MKARNFPIILAVLTLATFSALLLAQAGSADLTGRVLDATGAAVGSATVKVTDLSTNLSKECRTTNSGDYSFLGLKPDNYRIGVSAAGFKVMQRNSVALETGHRVLLDLDLQVGSTSEVVVVKAHEPLLQSASSYVETVIHGETVPDMPLNGRNFVQLATLSPGVELPPGTLLPRINGGRPRTNEYLFDGISSLQPEPGQVAFMPIVDDIQEFNIETNAVPAEFGRFNGGVVNLSTKGGSNEFHATAYDYFRNEALNAKDYFASSTTHKPEFRRNQYGGTLGGPMVKNRLYFFSDYQGQRLIKGVVRTSTVPTLAERGGDFSASGLNPIYDPATTTYSGGTYSRTQFSGNKIDSGRFDAAAVKLLAFYPEPTSTASANNYSRVANYFTHTNQFDTRVDGKFRKNDQGFVRYTYFNDVQQQAMFLPDGSGSITGSVLGTDNVADLSRVLGQQLVINETHTFSSSALNDLHLGYTRRSNNIVGTSLSDLPSSVFGIPGIPTNAAYNYAMPLFTVSGFQQLGQTGGTFSNYETSVTQLVDAFSRTSGAHTFKVGLDLRWYQLNAMAPGSPTGDFAFTTTGTNQQGVTKSGNALASLLLGQVDNFKIDLQQNKMRPRDHTAEFFVQDDWRLARKLTVNAGVRWTLNSPSTEVNDQGAIFNLSTQQLQYLGKDGTSRSARELHWDNFGPRVGLAYQMTSKTVVRSAFGVVFFDQSGITTPFTTPQFPFIQTVAQQTQDSINKAFQLSNGPTVSSISLTADAGRGQSVYTSPRKLGSGYVQQWNLGVERELTSTLTLGVTYVGSHVVHVGMPDTNLNQLTVDQLALGDALKAKVTNPCSDMPSSSSIGGSKITYAQSIKPYPCFLNVASYRKNTGNTNYNGVEAKLEQRLSNGLSFVVSYTHSKLIDDASSVFSTTVLSSPNSSSLIAADTYNPRLERDSSTGDMPDVVTASASYKLPAGKGYEFAQSGIAAQIFGGWSVNGIFLSQSGMPVTVTQSTNNNSFAGFALQRPNITGDVNLPKSKRTAAQYFNTAAFETAGAYTIGNASRNPVRGPGYHDVDLAFIKHTSIGERADFEFRVEVFNLSNSPAFAQPNGSFGAASFGTITATATDPRVIQFGARIKY
jgi:hypothetical protein